MTPEYSIAWNRTLMWMLVIMPISKFALGTRPLSTTIEAFLGVETTSGQGFHLNASPLRILVRAMIATAAVGISISIPEFSSVMAFLGSFSAFTICIIGPVSAHMRLNGARWWEVGILLVACIMAIWGTAASFLP